ESQMAVGANRNSAKGLFIQLVVERQGNGGGTVIGVVTAIGRPRDDAASPDGVGVIGARTWTGCWGRRNSRCRGGCCRRGGCRRWAGARGRGSWWAEGVGLLVVNGASGAAGVGGEEPGAVLDPNGPRPSH